MSLYYEATAILANKEKKGGSLKSRVYGDKSLKNAPSKLFALLVQSLKWSPILKEIIERSELLKIERRLTPAVAVLLVHDLLLSKGGIATPRTHPLRAAVEKHKARLSAEFTRSRIRQGFSSVESFRDHIEGRINKTPSSDQCGTSTNFYHPRWIRINTLRSTLAEQLTKTFDGYQKTERLEDVLRVPSKQRLLHIDYNIPDLIAVPHGHDLSSTEAYKTGQIILQDKASCFPAYLLDPSSFNGDIVDTCAAPGNKTTHLAALFHSSNTDLNNSRKVFAFERNEERSLVLKKMVTRAGGDKIITVFGSKDFLAVNPRHSQFANVEGLLLDPSCSGTGIVGRDDEQNMSLPEPNTTTTDARRVPKKRRRHEARESKQPLAPDDEVENDFVNEYKTFEERLRTLSAFQLQLVERAMRFPRATKITYSTCSIYAEENEMVVVRALASKVAKDAGWQIMKRHDQPSGLRKWEVRGLRQACLKDAAMSATTPSDEIADACIRCEKGTKDGTMGFFVAAFVRDSAVVEKAAEDFEALDEGEWRGFSEKDEP